MRFMGNVARNRERKRVILLLLGFFTASVIYFNLLPRGETHRRNNAHLSRSAKTKESSTRLQDNNDDGDEKNVFKEIVANTGSKITQITQQWKYYKKWNAVNIMPKGWSYKGNDYQRCKVHTVGCFQPLEEEDKHSWIIETILGTNMTDWYCVKTCSKRSKRTFSMAGLRNGNKCLCAHYLNYSNQIPEENCGLHCPGDESLYCGGKDRITMVYQLTGQCTGVSSISNTSIYDSVFGCFEKSGSYLNNMEHYVADTDQSREICITKCESIGLPLACPVDHRSCYCGHLTASLPNPVDMDHCSSQSDDHVIIYRTLSEDRRCGKRRFLRLRELPKKIGLITFPGSGNTWTRFLIESATGIYTGSVFNSDWGLLSGGFMGELISAHDPKVSVVKSHSASMSGVRIDAVINVYRNPYDAIFAEFNRRASGGGHVGHAEESNFNHTAFKDLVMNRLVAGWYGVTRSSVQRSIPALIISFERMVQNPIKYADRMARFILGDNLNENELHERLLCLKLSSSGGFKRKKKPITFELYDKEMTTAINTKITLLASVLRDAGLDEMPDYIRPTD